MTYLNDFLTKFICRAVKFSAWFGWRRDTRPAQANSNAISIIGGRNKSCTGSDIAYRIGLARSENDHALESELANIFNTSREI